MRKTTGGIPHVAAMIEEDLKERDMGLDKPHIQALADIAASILAVRSVNTSELAVVLPRDVKSNEERYRYFTDFLRTQELTLFERCKVLSQRCRSSKPGWKNSCFKGLLRASA